MKSRWYYTKKRENYLALFNNETDKAKMEYNRNMDFRRFVAEWNIDDPETLGYTLSDFLRIYKSGGMQLTFNFQ